MVSSPHEAMHRIFQEYPELFSRVSKVLGVPFSPLTSVTVLPTDLTESRPVERRVDTLLHLRNAADGGFLVAVEAQGKKDPGKPRTWAYYVSYLYEKYGLPPVLLVVCQDRATAEWAERPTHFGPANWATLTLRPLVVGPHNMPVITSADEAQKDLAFATLSAITHASNPAVSAILDALSTALRDEAEDLVNPVVEFIAQGLGNRPAADYWRNLVAVDLSFYKSPLSDGIRAESRAEDILLILEQRDISVPDSVRQRVNDCEDPEVMRSWLLRALTVTSAEKLFGDE
ncbi:hypothetical protein [Streptomyces sp. TRM64462]|uniref:hypothetical protein n=1 Tax=Streptomyces sp. TRM64462 TaxID=2741726 RepID=UPI0015866C81|nr:hypothetical protein [Streptomyces sp. TRM64462]